MSKRLLSLFSGCGGLDLGFEQAGFEIPLAIDIDHAACATYAKHHSAAVVKGNLARMGAKQLIRHWEVVSPEAPPIGVIGGPPCQFFSGGNVHRKPTDARRHLPARYARTLAELNARFDLKFFLFENVRGLTGAAHAKDYQRLLKLFDVAGFDLFVDFLDAQFYGVPQVRRRVFIVGFNKNLRRKAFAFPRRLAGPPPTVQVALSAAGAEPRYFSRSQSPEKGGTTIHPNHWTMRPLSPRFSTGELLPGTNRGRSFRVLDPEKPSPTVAYGHRELHIHPNGRRRITILEAMLLQGFPPDYHILGNFSEQVDQVSNAVCPPVAKALADSIHAALAAR